MRKLFALLLALTAICTMAYAENAFDPAQYTEEELREIDTLIHMHLTKTEEGTVLYDDNGIYVEYRGLYPAKWNSGIGVNVFIQNNSGKNLIFEIYGEKVNKANLGFNCTIYFWVMDGIMHMTKPEGQWVMEFRTLREWGFTTIQSIDFTISVQEGNRKEHCRIPVSLTLDYPIVYPE